LPQLIRWQPSSDEPSADFDRILDVCSFSYDLCSNCSGAVHAFSDAAQDGPSIGGQSVNQREERLSHPRHIHLLLLLHHSRKGQQLPEFLRDREREYRVLGMA